MQVQVTPRTASQQRMSRAQDVETAAVVCGPHVDDCSASELSKLADDASCRISRILPLCNPWPDDPLEGTGNTSSPRKQIAIVPTWEGPRTEHSLKDDDCRDI